MDFRSHFQFKPGFIHLNNAGCTPLLKVAQEEISKAANYHADFAFHSVPHFTQKFIDSRMSAAKFFGTRPEFVAMAQNCATAISIVARGLTFKSGDEILTWDQEYPSNAYIWYSVAKESGAKVIALPSEKNYEMNLELLLSKINSRTRIVTLSWVQSVAGTMIELKPVLEACEKVGAWFVVDAFQGLGAIPFKLSDYPGMIIATGTQKWTCGPLGHGYLAFSDDRYLKLNPILQGAMTFGGSDQTNPALPFVPTASRFEPGTPLLLTAFAAAAAFDLLEQFGVANIQKKNIQLRDYLIRGLDKLDAQIMGTRDSSKSGPHVTFVPRKSIEECAKRLLENKVSYVTKAKGLRISPHAFNTFEELDVALDCIK